MRPSSHLLSSMLFVVLLCVVVPMANGAIMAIDFGNRFIKIGMVQKGKPFHIVTDESSKRKCPTIVGFDEGERRFGNGAKSMLARKPKRTFEKMRNLLGQSINSPAFSYFKEGGYPHIFKEDEDSSSVTLDFSAGNATEFSIEQMVAMSLEYVKTLCEMDAEEPVKDAVIAVPTHWNAAQRKAMLDAGSLAGLNIISLINENTAAALQHGIDLDFKPNMSDLVGIYNMGDSTTQVSVVKYSSYTKKKGSSNRTIGQLEVLSTAFDESLGGDAFDRVIASHLAKEFNAFAAKKGIKGYDITQHPRPMAKLMAHSNKVKHVLSANQDKAIYIESLAEDLDFKSHLTRADFYEMADSLIQRVKAPLEDAIQKAGIDVSQLKTTLVIGGSVRIPAVQESLKKVLGNDGLGFSLDGDESVALGSAFFAANLSTAFRVRPIGLVDRMFEEIKIDIDSPEEKVQMVPEEDDGSGAGSGEQVVLPRFHKSTSLFPTNSKLGTKKSVKVRHDRDFTVKVAYNSQQEQGEGDEEGGIGFFNVTGVARAVARVQNRTSEKPKVQVSFRLTTSGLVEVEAASVSVERTKLVKKNKKKKSTKDSAILEDLLKSDKNFTRCEADEDDCSKCTHYATNCKSFQKCDELKAKKSASELKIGGVLRLVLGETDTCTVQQGDQEGEANKGCYIKNAFGTMPCFAEEKEEEASASSSEENKDKDDATPEEEAAKDETAKTDDAEKTEEEKKKEEEPEEEIQKSWVKKSLKYTSLPFGKVKGLSKEDIKAQRTILNHLTKQDQMAQKIAEAKNKVESYVYSARGMLRDEAAEEVTTEEERETLMASLEAVEDWLYDQDAQDDTLDKFTSKFDEMKAFMKAVEHRVHEFEERPKAISKSREIIEGSEKWISTLSNRTWIKATDVDGLKEKVATFSSWVDEMEAKQSETPATEAPAFNSTSVYTKMSILVKAAERLLSKKKPKAPPKPLDYVRCETGKKNNTCTKCTHYASGCYSFETCKSNNTRYALYGKSSKCTYSETEKGCVYSPTKDTLLGYPCFKGVPKKKTKKAKKEEGTETTNTTSTEEADDKPTEEEANKAEGEAEPEPSTQNSQDKEGTRAQDEL
mmetsp:Transcript_7793/g.15023  ORF Transcript_7793/g.15023 Transcript_7793/m.15023 type:complete len:1102 (-) Transcript_7793:178-3483(-)